ncbi:ParB/RepB/Spo0J family partition protein [Variovorax sp. J22P168]|uniref:ParB/RepB/Spo0J family partition protein n=1 Tax=Variovorax jilinensis TaxID=3053513 RepID=UPI00257700B6|nr:ParB/RepB/Spo0J family partition protein [Variovorax sp. J22P168]MDM0015858.1 ParB/RepB/Spo0J family partition protein [Variovorax sp. J22P168]
MANKNLIKRAFSVTANLPPAPSSTSPDPTAAGANNAAPPKSSAVVDSELVAGEGTPVAPGGHADRAGRSPVQPASAWVAPPVGPAAVKPPGTPKTAPGSLLAFMASQSDVHKEAIALRERLATFEGAKVTRHLDPRTIRPSNWANRDPAHFETAGFRQLKEEIGGAGGNVQPIKVRPIATPGAQDPQFEVVFGHRRHRACLELGLPVLAMIEPGLNDTQLFVEMERENRGREDLSAWEQGVMYLRALEQGLFPSAKQMAAAIDGDPSNIGKAMALARLPGEVVSAFGSPLNLQFRWASFLRDAHQRDPERLLQSAREVSARQPRPKPAEVFAALTGARKAARAALTPSEWKDEQGERVATLSFDRKGRATVAFDHPMDESQRRRLTKLIEGFVARKGP